MSASFDGPSLNDFVGSAQIFISAVNDLMEEQLRSVADGAVTFSQLKLLKMVSLTEDYSVSHVAQFLGVSAAAASRAVDRLVRRGFINRTPAEDDRRAVRLSLTDAGADLLWKYDRAASRALAQAFGDLEGDQIRQVGQLLDRLSVNIVDRANGSDEVCLRCGIHVRDRCLLRQRRSRSCFFNLHECRRPDGTSGHPHSERGRSPRSP